MPRCVVIIAALDKESERMSEEKEREREIERSARANGID